MPFTAGSRVTAASLNRITRNDLEAVLSADYTATTTETDVPSLSVTLTTTQANTKVKITASLDCEVLNGLDILLVPCRVDGVNLLGDLIYRVDGRTHCSKTWETTLGSVGSHTIKLRAYKIGNADTIVIYQSHSRLIISGNGIS